MKIIKADDVRAWMSGEEKPLSAYTHSIGKNSADVEYVESSLGVPFHLIYAIREMVAEGGEPLPKNAFDSIPFFSLCKGLLLPLSGLAPDRVAQLFGFQQEDPPDSVAREKLLNDFVSRDLGMSLTLKLGCILGDPFLGRPSTFKRDSLLRLLMQASMSKRRALLDRLTVVGDVAVLFAESRPRLHEDPPLTSSEVLETLRLIPRERRTERFDILRSLLLRCGKLEAYFLAKLLLRKAGFGFDYQGPLLARVLSAKFKVDEAQILGAIGLTDIYHVARVLTTEGPEGLRKIQMQPLVPVRPALSGGTTDEMPASAFPTWVERKYDGIRLMLHKSTDARGATLCGAYTRNRHDWLELVRGLDMTIRALPCRNVIVDGELYGTVMTLDGARPASVYEVYAALQGEQGALPVSLKFAAFDLVYLEGTDLTRRPLSERRTRLAQLVAPLSAFPTPIPVSVSEGQLAQNKDDVNRLYQHFRAQGYEGIIAKNPHGEYLLGARDPEWRKRKPEITLDLVLMGAILAVTTKESAGRFGSYVIGARGPDGSWVDVGDVAGVDRERDLQIQGEIMREGLLTGRRIERASSSGVRPGFELRPDIVVTVRFEGVVRENPTGASSDAKLSLRDPKLVVIRSDKQPTECDSTKMIEELYLRGRVG